MRRVGEEPPVIAEAESVVGEPTDDKRLDNDAQDRPVGEGEQEDERRREERRGRHAARRHPAAGPRCHGEG